MHPRSLLVVLLLAAVVSPAGFAQTPPATRDREVANRRTPPPPTTSPEVHEDGRVTFRIRAPKATEVAVSGQWNANQRIAMTRGTNDIWSVTAGPIAPGVWEYSLVLDGVNHIDPGNPAIKPMREPRTSILHLPSNPPSLVDFQDVPHGTVEQHTYRSKALGRLRELAVYLPPGYSASKRYPVLYLQHGSGDNQATWVAHGKAHWVLDNLIAQRKAKPMIVVMMDGHAAPRGAAVAGVDSNTAAFERDLLEDVLPWVENRYRVRKDPAGRAIVGLSMGGGQSLGIGLRHLSLFGWVGGFSSAVPSAEAVKVALDDPDGTNKRLKLLWIACGKDDFLLQRNKEFVATLGAKGVRHQWLLTEGNHSWPVWRGYLADFVPLLF